MIMLEKVTVYDVIELKNIEGLVVESGRDYVLVMSRFGMHHAVKSNVTKGWKSESANAFDYLKARNGGAELFYKTFEKSQRETPLAWRDIVSLKD